MADKNPYEVRLDILKLAQQMHQDRLSADHTVFQNNINLLAGSSANFYNPEQVSAAIQAVAPKPYSEADVLKTSEALYAFVNTRSTRTDNSNVTNVINNPVGPVKGSRNIGPSQITERPPAPTPTIPKT